MKPVTSVLFQAVEIVTPFKMRNLGDLILPDAAYDLIGQIAGELGLGIREVHSGYMVVSGTEADIVACKGHYHVVPRIQYGHPAIIEFVDGPQGWSLQISTQSEELARGLLAITGAENVLPGTAIDDLISAGVEALRGEGDEGLESMLEIFSAMQGDDPEFQIAILDS